MLRCIVVPTTSLLQRYVINFQDQSAAQPPAKVDNKVVSSRPETRESEKASPKQAQQQTTVLPKAVENIPREPAPFAPPPAPVAKETHRVQTPKDNVKSAPSVEPAPTQQRNEKPVMAPQSNMGELNLKDFMPVILYI